MLLSRHAFAMQPLSFVRCSIFYDSQFHDSFMYFTSFPLKITFSAACTTIFTVQVNWLWEQTSIVLNTKLNQNGKILYVLMGGSGLSAFLGGNLTLVGCIQ